MKKLVVVALFLLASNALAAEVSWMYVQNRSYENGRKINRLAFGLVDEKGYILTDGRSVVDVKLYDPTGNPVKLSKYRFDSDEEIYGIYDAIKSRWLYADSWQGDSWFRANFSDPLISGTYRLKVATADGKLAQGGFNFNKIVDLPIISSISFKFYYIFEN